MNTGSDQLPTWIPQAVRNDPKKSGILGVLLLVLGIAVIRYFLLTGGPATAKAAPATPTQPIKTKAASKAAAAQLSSTAGISRKWIKEPIPVLGRNLFAVKPEYFQYAEGVQLTKAVQTAGFWDAIEKSLNQQADLKKGREILAENLQREAAKLKLQSTVMGPEPQAIIGGSLVKEGNVVASDAGSNGVQFRVLKIEPRRVVLEREGIKLELRMEK
jgi:hypothetical protein